MQDFRLFEIRDPVTRKCPTPKKLISEKLHLIMRWVIRGPAAWGGFRQSIILNCQSSDQLFLIMRIIKNSEEYFNILVR